MLETSLPGRIPCEIVAALSDDDGRAAAIAALRSRLAEPATRTAALIALGAVLRTRPGPTCALLLCEAGEPATPRVVQALVDGLAFDSCADERSQSLRALLRGPAAAAARTELAAALPTHDGRAARSGNGGARAAWLLVESGAVVTPEVVEAIGTGLAYDSTYDANRAMLTRLLADGRMASATRGPHGTHLHALASFCR